MEETIEYSTIGSVIHDTLEELYTPIKNKKLKTEDVKEMMKIKDEIIDNHFQKKFKEGNINKGKNLIIVEICKRYVHNFLNKEIKDIEEGNIINIIGIEEKFEYSINLSDKMKDIKIKGKIDRIDNINGVTRIIDYKTGRQILQSDLKIKDYDDVFNNKKYSNIFQLLFYCLAIEQDNKYNFPVESGIISFRNLDNGVIKTTFQDTSTKVTTGKLKNYKKGLNKLISDILEINIPFTEKP